MPYHMLVGALPPRHVLHQLPTLTSKDIDVIFLNQAPSELTYASNAQAQELHSRIFYPLHQQSQAQMYQVATVDYNWPAVFRACTAVACQATKILQKLANMNNQIVNDARFSTDSSQSLPHKILSQIIMNEMHQITVLAMCHRRFNAFKVHREEWECSLQRLCVGLSHLATRCEMMISKKLYTPSHPINIMMQLRDITSVFDSLSRRTLSHWITLDTNGAKILRKSLMIATFSISETTRLVDVLANEIVAIGKLHEITQAIVERALEEFRSPIGSSGDEQGATAVREAIHTILTQGLVEGALEELEGYDLDE